MAEDIKNIKIKQGNTQYTQDSIKYGDQYPYMVKVKNTETQEENIVFEKKTSELIINVNTSSRTSLTVVIKRDSGITSIPINTSPNPITIPMNFREPFSLTFYRNVGDDNPIINISIYNYNYITRESEDPIVLQLTDYNQHYANGLNNAGTVIIRID